jgi:hypothetical protein
MTAVGYSRECHDLKNKHLADFVTAGTITGDGPQSSPLCLSGTVLSGWAMTDCKDSPKNVQRLSHTCVTMGLVNSTMDSTSHHEVLPQSSPKAAEVTEDYEYKGCYRDKGVADVAAPGFPYRMAVNRWAKYVNVPFDWCHTNCRAAGFRYFTQRLQRECFCGDSVGELYWPISECNCGNPYLSPLSTTRIKTRTSCVYEIKRKGGEVCAVDAQSRLVACAGGQSSTGREFLLVDAGNGRIALRAHGALSLRPY